MRYSKSLDFVISALVYARKGKLDQAGALFDKALAFKDLAPTIARLEKMQVAAFDADFPKKKTTAQVLREVAAKKAKAKAKKVLPKGKMKKAKAKIKVKAAEGLDDDEDFDQITDDMTVGNGEADDDTPASGIPGGVSMAEEGDDDLDEFMGDDDLGDDAMELPEAKATADADDTSDTTPLNDLEMADLDDLAEDDLDLDMDLDMDGDPDAGVVDEFEEMPTDDAFDVSAEAAEGDDDDSDGDDDDDEDKAEAAGEPDDEDEEAPGNDEGKGKGKEESKAKQPKIKSQAAVRLEHHNLVKSSKQRFTAAEQNALQWVAKARQQKAVANKSALAARDKVKAPASPIATKSMAKAHLSQVQRNHRALASLRKV